MLSNLLIVRLKTAENALKDGRLDEAFRLATAPDIREHRRGGALLCGLTDKFIERARAHFAEERFTEALGDLDKAEAGGLKSETIAELREQVRAVANEVERQARSQRRRIEKAKARVEGGSLAAGKQLLAEAGADDLDAKQLSSDIEHRRREVSEGMAHVERLVKEKQLGAAAERFRAVKRLDRHDPKVVSMESTLCARVIASAREALEAGRTRRAAEELDVLGELGRQLPARRDLEEILALTGSVSGALGQGDFEGARRNMLRLQRLSPKTSWIRTAADQLAKLDELLTNLHGGPLGDQLGGGERKIEVGGRRASLDETVAVGNKSRVAGELPSRMLLLVDGAGSYLILRDGRVSIGRATSSRPADIAILSDLAERHAEIARVEDDYFLFSPHDVQIDGRWTRHQLLRDGNRVALAKNARFSFRLPHRQSSSCTIEMSSSTKMPHDVRRVILFRQTAMLGAGKSAHVRCNSAERDMVLFERAGQLWIRALGNGRVQTEAHPVMLGEQMELFGVSFVVQPFKTFGSGRAIG